MLFQSFVWLLFNMRGCCSSVGFCDLSFNVCDIFCCLMREILSFFVCAGVDDHNFWRVVQLF